MTIRRVHTLVIGTLLATAAAAAQAQTERVAIDPKWRAFLGCWASSAAGSAGPTVCLVPTASADRIEMISVANDSIIGRVAITASGARTEITRDGCTGWESGRWSADDRRFFTRAEFSCDGGATQSSTGIFAMSHADAFSRIEGVKTKGATRVRVINFIWRDTVPAPGAIASRLPRLDALPTVGAHIEAAATVTTADVIEATKQVDAAVVEAWLADRGQRFDVTVKDLRALRDAGVPTGVIDMVVAVSHPKVFAIAPGGQPGGRPAAMNTQSPRSMNAMALQSYMTDLRLMRLRSALSFGWGDLYFPYSGYSGLYGAGFFSPFAGGYYGGLNNWYGGGYGGYGNGIFVGNQPYVIVPQSPQSSQPDRGRVVNGAGYTQDGGSTSGIARPTATVNSGGYSSGSGMSSGGSAGGGAAGGGDGGRTAKPRP